DVGAARARLLPLIHHEKPRALSDHKAIAVARKRPRSALWLMVPTGGHDPHELKAAHDERRDRRIHTAHDHGIQISTADLPEGIAHRVGGRRAAGRDNMAQPAEAEPHGNFAGQRADGDGGYGVRATLLLMSGVIQAVLLFGEVLAAAARSDDYADAAK